jgi:hypothetical protein
MFADPFQVPVLMTSGAATFGNATLVELQGNNSVRRFSQAEPNMPKFLKISHNQVGKGQNARDRHLARIEGFVHDADGIETHIPYALYAVADIPRVGVSPAELQRLYRRFTGLFFGGSSNTTYGHDENYFYNRWLRGES